MSESNAPEPTMEEILASIRRIISEDEPPAGEPAPEAAHEPAPEPAHHEVEDVLELTEPVKEEPAIETHGDIEVHAPAPVAPAPQPAPQASPVLAAVPPPPPHEDALVSGETAATAASAFGHLAQHVALPSEGRTLEDLVRELVKPLLKSWLDANLPTIVQAKVEEEVERIARRRGI